MSSKHKKLGVTIALIWLMAMIWGFWWFEFRYYSVFASADDLKLNGLPTFFEGSQFQADAFSQLKLEGNIVINVLDFECPCSKYTVPHLLALKKRYGELGGNEFVLWSKADEIPRELDFMPQLSLKIKDLLNGFVPASPAVLILDELKNIAYFGPYSSGAFCGQGKSFVDVTLNKLSQGVNPKFLNSAAKGCFCKW